MHEFFFAVCSDACGRAGELIAMLADFDDCVRVLSLPVTGELMMSVEGGLERFGPHPGLIAYDALWSSLAPI